MDILGCLGLRCHDRAVGTAAAAAGEVDIPGCLGLRCHDRAVGCQNLAPLRAGLGEGHRWRHPRHQGELCAAGPAADRAADGGWRKIGQRQVHDLPAADFGSLDKEHKSTKRVHTTA